MKAARIAAVFAVVAGAAAGTVHVLAAAPSDRAEAAPFRVSTLTGEGRRRRAALSWWGGSFTAASGETVRVHLSAAYPRDDALGVRWASYFASLLHGPELAAARVYVAPLAEVEAVCGAGGVLGCYAADELVLVGETTAGVTAEAVAAHEYGHHVAAHRLNPPWEAIGWGPKRWATRAGVCARVRAGSAHPGDEGERYTTNPGEAFAEAFRAANEARSGAAFGWSLVDASFYPDAAALRAVEEDVLRPWAPRPATRISARFTARGPRVWRRRVATPLDGDVEVVLRPGPARAHALELVTGAGVVKGYWAGRDRVVLRATVCGERSVVVRVRRNGPAGPISVSVRAPR
jgi:hypothetical protein